VSFGCAISAEVLSLNGVVPFAPSHKEYSTFGSRCDLVTKPLTSKDTTHSHILADQTADIPSGAKPTDISSLASLPGLHYRQLVTKKVRRRIIFSSGNSLWFGQEITKNGATDI